MDWIKALYSSRYPARSFSLLRVILFLLITGTIAETSVMVLLSFAPPLPMQAILLLDTVLTVLLVVPIVLYGVLRPLRALDEERRRSDEALKRSYSELEQRVEERTSKLASLNQVLLEEVAERKKAEEALIQKDQHLEQFLRQVPAILWATDSDLRLTYAAGSGFSWINRSADQVIGRLITDEGLINTQHPVYQAHVAALAGQASTFELEVDGRFFQFYIEPFLNPDGEIFGSMGLSLDITEQKKNTELIRLQAAALEAAANGIIITNQAGNIQWANPAFTRITGFSTEEILGKNPRFLKSGFQNKTFYEDMWSTILSGNLWHAEVVNRRKDGSLYAEEQSIAPVINEHGEITNFISIRLDITKRKAAENEVHRRNMELARLYELERQSRQTAETLRQASLALSQSLDIDTLLKTLVGFAKSLLNSDITRVYLLHGPKDFVIHTTSGETQAYPCHPDRLDFTHPDDPLLHEVLEKQQSLLIDDTHAYFGWEVCPAKYCTRSWVVSPIKTGNDILGILAAGKTKAGSFSHKQLQLLEALVSQIAAALQNAWLFEQVRTSQERMRSLSHRLVTIQEAERNYISRELHDETSQALASLMVNLNLLKRSADQPEAVISRAAQLEGMVSDVMENLHRIAEKLRPAQLDHLGLASALQRAIEGMREKYNLDIQYEMFGIRKRLPREVEINLYRVIQEALTNVVRHAHATHVDVLIENNDEHLVLIVEDDGIGFNLGSESDNRRLGIVGIQERAEMIGGELFIESTPGKGTTLKLEVPWAKESHHDI